MSPPVFLLGLVSIPTVWAITIFGLPRDLWTFGVVPVVSIYLLCDQGKLWQAAAQVRSSQILRFISPAIVVLFALVYAQFTDIRFLLWKAAVLVVWLLCVIKAFHFEKQMYLTDTFGVWAKYLVWEMVSRVTGEAMWMSYKSEWAYCSPYSRKLVHKDIQHYYNLQQRSEEQEIIPEHYEFNFPIESCNVYSVYTPASEDRGADYSSSSSTVSSSPMVENRPSPRPRIGPIEVKERAERGSSSSTTTLSSTEGESSSSSKFERGPLVEDSYSLISSHMNKVEVSLQYEGKTLEGYTFFDIASDAVAEFKRVLEVLKRDGNVIYSTLNRNIGSSTPRAHARCHEFKELLDLILNQSYKLHEVDLTAQYKCIISGHWSLQLLLIGVMVGIDYYQLTGPPKYIGTVIALLTSYALLHLFLVVVNFVCGKQHKLKRLVHFIISRTRPNKLDDWYRYFQKKFPLLTFSNESYCYPQVSTQKQICFLKNAIGCLPVTGTGPARYFHMEDLREGRRVFDLRNLQLELSVTYIEEEVQINAEMRRAYDDRACCYREVFLTDRIKAIHFIALMKWLEENGCVGVCKEWPESGLMYAYRYRELFHLVLLKGFRPMVSPFLSPIDITVE
ncbi:unnamed protein product [Calypogeia fissa]